MLAVCLCVSIVQLCGCSLVVLGLYLHADRQSSIYLDLLMTRQGEALDRGGVCSISRPAAVGSRLRTAGHHWSPGQGARCHGNQVHSLSWERP